MFDLNTLNHKHHECISKFLSFAENELEPIIGDVIFPIHFSESTINGSVGSLLAQPIHDFIPLISAFTKHPLANDDRKLKILDDRIAELQHQHAYLYLTLQLILGLRPIGLQTELYFYHNISGLVIKQKDSANNKERSLIPIPIIIRNQLESCRNALDYIISYVQKRGYTIRYPSEININSPYPLNIVIDKTNKSITLSVMHGSHFTQYLENIGLYNLVPGEIKKNNIYRHSLYSHLLQHVSDAFISELFQHHIGDLGLFSKFSNANFNQYCELANILDNLAEELGFGVIK